MRNIKFRAVYKGKVYKVTFIDFENKSVDIDVDGVKTTTSIKNTSIMQYTGLKDKNGKDIYEGDIVKIKIGSEVWRYEVGWEVESFVLKRYGLLSEYRDDTKYLEVIGNIFEHDYLLENKEK